MNVKGTIKEILPLQTGTKKDGSEWQKQSFLLETDEKYNNLYCFELFGEEKVSNFNTYHKVGKLVDVEFNVSTNEYKGNYYTSLQAWRVSTVTDAPTTVNNFEVIEPESLSVPADDLPFS